MDRKVHQRAFDYRCGECGRKCDRDELAVKRVVWVEMGVGGKMIRSRSVGWVCKNQCMVNDPVYQRKPLAASPGFRNTDIAELPPIEEDES